jgi:hypothetical protein
MLYKKAHCKVWRASHIAIALQSCSLDLARERPQDCAGTSVPPRPAYLGALRRTEPIIWCRSRITLKSCLSRIKNFGDSFKNSRADARPGSQANCFGRIHSQAQTRIRSNVCTELNMLLPYRAHQSMVWSEIRRQSLAQSLPESSHCHARFLGPVPNSPHRLVNARIVRSS